MQFGAFSPLFRLHGHRDGGPPTNECGPTNGDNEIWNLAKDPAHYDAMVSMMRLRESLREYVSESNQEHSQSGFPMVRPMMLAFPLDTMAQSIDAEDQFMFGAQWLVAPVYIYQAQSRSVYLPLLNATSEWVYYFNFSSVGQGGARVDVLTPLAEFPLFFIRPITPPAPPALTAVNSLYSSSRLDSVLCASDSCDTSNAPSEPGAYVSLRIEGYTTMTEGPIQINGVSYDTVPLHLYFSYTRNDNCVTTNSTPPDSTYTVSMDGGYAFSGLPTPPPKSYRISYFYKANNATTWDYASVASDAGIAWAKQNGYTDVTNQVAIEAYILTSLP